MKNGRKKIKPFFTGRVILSQNPPRVNKFLRKKAHQILNEGNYHGKKRKNTVDAVAASLILEGYLAYLRNHKE